MYNNPTKPGQTCLVIGGRLAFNDEGKGPNIGKTVTTVFLHPEKAGDEQEDVWRCSGESLVTYHGALGDQADFLGCWLEVIEPGQTTDSEKKDEVLNVE